MLNPHPDLKVLVISLVFQSDRRQRISEHLNALGLDWEFVDAVVGKDLQQLPPEYDQAKRLKYHSRALSTGEIACFLSHRKIWGEYCHDPGKLYLVLEDDTELLAHFDAALAMARNSRAEWDVFRMHGIWEREYQVIRELGSLQLIENLRDPASSAAFLLDHVGAAKLLQASAQFDCPIDDFVEQRYLHGIRVLAVRPYPVKADIGVSSIARQPARNGGMLAKLRREILKIPQSLAKRAWRKQRRAALNSQSPDSGRKP